MTIAAVMGLGYVGLPLAVHMAKAGHQTIGFDVSQKRLQEVMDGTVRIDSPYAQDASDLYDRQRLRLTSDGAVLREADFISICVPTPLDRMKTPDLSFVEAACEILVPSLRRGQVIILESTTFPGTTADVVRPILESSGLCCGSDYFLGYSPERVDPANTVFDTQNTPKVVGADDEEALARIVEFYRTFIDVVVPVSSTKAAEMTKLLENTFRAVNIAFVNEMAIMCERLGIDVWEVLRAAATKPFGFMPFSPGPGIGGHCIPLDPLYLSWKAKSVNFFSRFIETAADINNNMPHHVVDRVLRLIGSRGRAASEARVLLLGVAYKPNVTDYRESPSVEVMRLLIKEHVAVEYHDPHVPVMDLDGKVFESVPGDALFVYDCVVGLVNHDVFDLSKIVAQSKFIFDTKGMFDTHATNVLRLGDGAHSLTMTGETTRAGSGPSM